MTSADNKQQNKTPEKKPVIGKGTWDIRPYLAVGLTAILVVFICLAIFFFIFRFQAISAGVGKVIASLRGIIFGFILAYLLNPGMMFLERNFKKKMFVKGERTKKQENIIRGLSVTCAMAVFLAVIAVLAILIIPQLVSSIQDLVISMEDKVQTMMEWIEKFMHGDNQLEYNVEVIIGNVAESLRDWMKEKIIGAQGDIITSLTAGVYNVVKLIFNLVVGLIVAVYVLMTKEKFVGQTKKLIYAIFKPRFGNFIMEVVQRADDVFGGFFIGKIIDSIIIGCISFVCLSVMNMPYAVLVSVIVGVTNIIPFFGPYIGAIPSAVLIFLVDPLHALYFLIFIVILQQIDGNILGPKILGNTTGLSPFWVIFSCILFGGCFGVAGMIFGVPVFAVIYYIIKRLAEYFLRKKKLPADTGDYVKLERVDVDTNEIQNMKEEKKLIMIQREKDRVHTKKEEQE